MLCCVLTEGVAGQRAEADERRIVVDSEGWELVGDLVLPRGGGPVPAVLMLNGAAGDRRPYAELARFLVERGVGSLRLDLRGHGESVGLGRFVPGERGRDPLIWDAERDVRAAIEYLRADPAIDGTALGIVGASYSGEEMAEAGRLYGYARVYVALSPGSFSEESILGIDASGADWLFIASRNDRFLVDIVTGVREESGTVELVILPGSDHGTAILTAGRGMAERIAVWVSERLLG